MDPATPKPGETGVPKAPENVTPTSAPNQGNANDTAVEQLRKEKEQAEMRANQLANELAAKKRAEEEAEAKRLAENNEFKTLHEQERAKREALESRLEAEERQKELDKVRAEALKAYTDEVKAEAEALGITLSSTDEAEVAAYKEKLDRLQKRESASGRVTPNNPNTTTGNPSQDELLQRVKYGDRNARAQAIGNLEAVKAMKAMAGYSDS